MLTRPASGTRVLTRKSIVLAAVAVLAACADNATAPRTGNAAPTFSEGGSESSFPTRHLFRTRQYYASQNLNAGGGGNPINNVVTPNTVIVNDTPHTAVMSYHNGPVLQNGTNVVAIYWGSSTYPVGYQNLPSGANTTGGTGDGSLIGIFLSGLSSLVDVANHKYFAINQTYTGQTGAQITPTVAYTGYWNTVGSGAPAPSAAPTDADMLALIQWGLSNGRLAYDANTVYAIFTGNGVNLGGKFAPYAPNDPQNYCAYHSHGATSRGNVYYAAMPYVQQDAGGCTALASSPNADVAANSEVNPLAHEIEETTTDAMLNAWYDATGLENADKCAYTWGTTATAPNGGDYNESYNGRYFLIQQNWVRPARISGSTVAGNVCATGLATTLHW